MEKIINSLKYSSLYELVFPFIQLGQTLKWLTGNKELATPHFFKQQIVKNYARKYSLRTLIETGTYLGVMVDATKKDFKKIYTIELDKKLFVRARKKFKKFHHIKVLFGNSTKVLPSLLKKINNECLFWLDAHYSKGITTKADKETPIIEDLMHIFLRVKMIIQR